MTTSQTGNRLNDLKQMLFTTANKVQSIPSVAGRSFVNRFETGISLPKDEHRISPSLISAEKGMKRQVSMMSTGGNEGEKPQFNPFLAKEELIKLVKPPPNYKDMDYM